MELFSSVLTSFPVKIFSMSISSPLKSGFKISLPIRSHSGITVDKRPPEIICQLKKAKIAQANLVGVVIKMANFFLNILDWLKARLSKWRTFLELSKWRIIFYQNGELFRSYQNDELLHYQNGELFLSKWRTFFYQKGEFRSRVILKMANFSL